MKELFELNKGQKKCVDYAHDWWNTSQRIPTFEFSGAPGTGKSTVAKYIIKAIGAKRPLYVAFTGNAVKELRKKGLYAKTIHSVAFDYEKTFLRIDGNLVMRQGYPVTTVAPIRKKFLEDDPDVIIVDECMMVNEELVEVLLSFGVPIIAMGDKDQLGPVIGQPGFFQDKIDYTLTEYMRQALDSGIIRVSKYVNEGGILKPGMDFGPEVEIIKKKHLRAKTLTLADINITSSNKMRRKINRAYREYMGYKNDMLARNEIILCKKNSWKNILHDNTPLVNGTLGYVKHYPNIGESDIRNNELLIDFAPMGADDYFYNIPIDMKHLFSDGVDTDKYNHSLLKFEFGYGITVYASQGAEYDSVLYIDDPINSPEFMRQNRYVALSRAKGVLGIAL